jgi:hypothetical protein
METNVDRRQTNYFHSGRLLAAIQVVHDRSNTIPSAFQLFQYSFLRRVVIIHKTRQNLSVWQRRTPRPVYCMFIKTQVAYKKIHKIQNPKHVFLTLQARCDCTLTRHMPPHRRHRSTVTSDITSLQHNATRKPGCLVRRICRNHRMPLFRVLEPSFIFRKHA